MVAVVSCSGLISSEALPLVLSSPPAEWLTSHLPRREVVPIGGLCARVRTTCPLVHLSCQDFAPLLSCPQHLQPPVVVRVLANGSVLPELLVGGHGRQVFRQVFW